MDAKDLDALRTKEYWEKRYTDEPLEHDFDWFRNYDELAPWFDGLLRPCARILMLGCGNSVPSPNSTRGYRTNIERRYLLVCMREDTEIYSTSTSQKLSSEKCPQNIPP